MRKSPGFSLIEVLVGLLILTIVITTTITMFAERQRRLHQANEKRYPINYMAHPEVGSLMARMRKDVFDTKYYPATFQSYQQTPQTLILYTLRQTGFGETVIWDFRTAGEVHRKAFNATQLTADWVARGVPDFQIGSFTLNTGQDAVRITAIDEQNRLAIDEIFVPRPHD